MKLNCHIYGILGDYGGYCKLTRKTYGIIYNHIQDTVISSLLGNSPIFDDQYDDIIKQIQNKKCNKNYSIYLQIIPPDVTHIVNSGYRILYTMAETVGIPDYWYDTLNDFDEIWTPSQYDYDLFSKKCNKPIYKIPILTETDYYCNSNKFENERLGIKYPHDQFVFLTVGAWNPRKGFDQLIECFLELFYKKHPVHLLIKTYGYCPDNAKNYLIENINKLKKKYPKMYRQITICSQNFSEKRLQKLYALVKNNGCYISNSIGEGMNMPLLEAMSNEIPCVASYCRAHTDFINENNAYPVKICGTQKKPELDFLTHSYHNQEFFVVDKESLKEQMWNVYKDENKHIKGQNARLEIIKNYSCDPISSKILERINDICINKDIKISTIPKIAACMICYNEEKIIEYSIMSTIDWCDKMIIVDGGPNGSSTDNTINIIKKLQEKYPDKIYFESGKYGSFELTNNWDMVQRNRYLEILEEKFPEINWIFYIDADEIWDQENLDKLKNKIIEEHSNVMIDSIFVGSYYFIKNTELISTNVPRIFRCCRMRKGMRYHDTYLIPKLGMRFDQARLHYDAQNEIKYYHYGHCFSNKMKEFRDKKLLLRGEQPFSHKITKFKGKHPEIAKELLQTIKEINKKDIEEFSEKYYPEDYYLREQLYNGDPKENLIKRADIFLKKLNLYEKKLDGKKCLDIGCGWGSLLFQLNKQGAICYGYDISKDVIDYCLKNKEENMYFDISDTFDIKIWNEKYNYIFMIDFIEHITKNDAILLSCLINESQNTNDKLIISTPLIHEEARRWFINLPIDQCPIPDKSEFIEWKKNMNLALPKELENWWINFYTSGGLNYEHLYLYHSIDEILEIFPNYNLEKFSNDICDNVHLLLSKI